MKLNADNIKRTRNGIQFGTSMDISKVLRDEIRRRGLSPAEIAKGAILPYSTANEFMRGVREVGADKASRIATFLGFDLTCSLIRKKTMSEYLAAVEKLENESVDTSDDAIESMTRFVEDLKWLENRGLDFNEDLTESVHRFRTDAQWLEDSGYDYNEDAVTSMEEFCEDARRLEEYGYRFNEDDAASVRQFREDLQFCIDNGEDVNEDRMAEVAEFVANLREIDQHD